MAKTAIVILNWNGIEYLKRFLGKVVELSSSSDTEIFLADNGSTDESVDWAEENNPFVKIAGVVCIESIYPEFVAGFIQKGADLITVVTNDSWYGYSSGPFQHKEISVLRAVENRRSVIRAANGGVSCIIDPLGNTIASTKLFTRDVLVGDVIINEGQTFYSQFPWIFPLFSSFISIITIMIFIFKKISTKIKNNHEKNY